MDFLWQHALLDALIALDASERTHGLYGIRLAYAKDPTRLPTLAQVLVSPERTNLIARLGFESMYSQARENTLDFMIDNTRAVHLKLLDYASTKVRRFGSSYRVDLHNRKQRAEPQWDMERLLPKLMHPEQPYELSTRRTTSLLLIAHAPTLRRIHALLGRARDESFLQKYDVSLCAREWADRYGRGFHSGLYLWSGPSDNALSTPTP